MKASVYNQILLSNGSATFMAQIHGSSSALFGSENGSSIACTLFLQYHGVKIQALSDVISIRMDTLD